MRFPVPCCSGRLSDDHASRLYRYTNVPQRDSSGTATYRWMSYPPRVDEEGSREVGTAPVPTSAVSSRPGRKRDASRDRVILEAAIEVLVEYGFEAMTVEMVAERARAGKGTVYRRWSTKGELVVAAIACLDQAPDNDMALPDGGSLRADLLGMINPHWLGTSERRVKILNALSTVIASSPEIAGMVDEVLVRPSTNAYRSLLERAVQRGEIQFGTDLDTLAQVIPSMAAYRAIYMDAPVDRSFLESIIETVLLPSALTGLPKQQDDN